MRAYASESRLASSYGQGARVRAPLVARALAEVPKKHRGTTSALSAERMDRIGRGGSRDLDALLCGRFEIKEVLADGAFSRVARAEDALFPDWRRHVAIKVLVADAGALGRREAAMLALLQGAPGVAIPEFYGAFESGPHYCIAMEACGPSLAAVSKERGALGERAVRRVATQLAAVLAYLELKRVIHADVKPENVLCARPIFGDGDADVRLIDFGNAIFPRETIRYYDDFEIQSPGYRAPEVLAGVPFSHKIDVFSLGVLLAELAVGRPLLAPDRRDRVAARRKMEQVLGPLPARRFAGAKFYALDDLPSCDVPEDVRRRKHKGRVRNLLADFPPRQPGDGTFASFAAALLELDPDDRPRPRAALAHRFLAAEFPFGAVFPAETQAPRARR